TGVAWIVDGRRGADGAVAEVRRAHVAVVRARRPRSLDGVGRTVRPIARAALGDVALVGRRTAGAGGESEGVGRGGGGAARARLGAVAPARGGRAADRAGVAGVVDARGRADRAVALVGRAHVAVVRAGCPRRCDGVGRTDRARAGTALGDVAFVDRCAA